MFKHATWLIPAALVGLVAGFVGSSLRHPVPLHAMTAHGSERKTLVTVPLDAGMEAVVALDHVTADLTGYVLDRFTGKFFIQYRYNVAKDFPLRQGKQPRFLMVVGPRGFPAIHEQRAFRRRRNLCLGRELGAGRRLRYPLELAVPGLDHGTAATSVHPPGLREDAVREHPRVRSPTMIRAGLDHTWRPCGAAKTV